LVEITLIRIAEVNTDQRRVPEKVGTLEGDQERTLIGKSRTGVKKISTRQNAGGKLTCVASIENAVKDNQLTESRSKCLFLNRGSNGVELRIVRVGEDHRVRRRERKQRRVGVMGVGRWVRDRRKKTDE
jgi:hypothetical protein